jgi:methylated-DNA-[protein]-cysteine S-methyltransferase
MLHQKRHLTSTADDRCSIVAFPTRLGWMALAARDDVLCQLTFGYSTKAAALRALGRRPTLGIEETEWSQALVRRLQAYAAGGSDDFRDVRVDLGDLTAFQRRVLEGCRRIPYATTASYAELAAMAGSPRAVRAVGNCMAGNRVPLVIPCHRVVQSGGRLGGYSAPGGLRTKRRLLQLEQGN